MSRKSKKRRKLKRSSHPRARATRNQLVDTSTTADAAINGYDFGLPTTMMAMGSPDFLNHLHDANVLGFAYGYAASKKLRASLPAITLMVRNEDAARAAFSEFSRWGADLDGDVLELAIVFHGNGEYTVGLGPEIDRLVDRLTSFNRLHEPLPIGMTWMLPVPSMSSPAVSEFAEKQTSGLVRPYLVNAASIAGADRNLRDGRWIRPISGLSELMKYECTIVRHKQKPTTPNAMVMVESFKRRSSGRNSRSRAPKDLDEMLTPELVTTRRQKLLQTYFPVTTERLTAFDLATGVRASLATRGIQQWQIEQAICNIVLSQRLFDGRPHYPDLRKPDSLKTAIVDALSKSHEEVDGNFRVLHGISEAQVVAQVEADGRVLLRAFDRKARPANLSALQAALDKKGLLRRG